MTGWEPGIVEFLQIGSRRNTGRGRWRRPDMTNRSAPGTQICSSRAATALTHRARDLLRCDRQGSGPEPSRHLRAHEARPDDENPAAVLADRLAEAGEERCPSPPWWIRRRSSSVVAVRRRRWTARPSRRVPAGTHLPGQGDSAADRGDVVGLRPGRARASTSGQAASCRRARRTPDGRRRRHRAPRRPPTSLRGRLRLAGVEVERLDRQPSASSSSTSGVATRSTGRAATCTASGVHWRRRPGRSRRRCRTSRRAGAATGAGRARRSWEVLRCRARVTDRAVGTRSELEDAVRGRRRVRTARKSSRRGYILASVASVSRASLAR